MQSERDYLNTHIFPLVRAELKKHAVSLRTIDLRWGVNTIDNPEHEDENEIENKIIRVCFDEIDRSKPFFLALLGERYGWIPSNAKSKEFSKKYQIGYHGSITSMEIEYGALKREDVHAIFLERDKTSYLELPQLFRGIYDDRYSSDPEKEQRVERLKTLKDNIKQNLRARNKTGNYITYSPQWDGRKFSSLEDFGQKVFQAIMAEVMAYLESEGSKGELSDQEREKNLQDEFLFGRSKILVERENLVDGIKQELLDTNEGIILVGESGTGKSSIYTSLVDYFKDLPHDKYVILYHSAGVNHESTRIFNMLRRWIWEIAHRSGSTAPEVQDTEQCLSVLKTLLKRLPQEIKVIMLIDSLDSFQAEKVSRHLSFFPRHEYRDMSLFCTSTPGFETYAVNHNHRIKTVGTPEMTENEARAIISSFFKYYRKELHNDVLETLLGCRYGQKPAYGSPLWLSIAMGLLLNIGEDDFAEVKAITSGSEEEKIITFQRSMIAEFPVESKALFRYFLCKMSSVYGTLPEDIFMLISASYKGLDETDMKQMLHKEWDQVSFAIIHGFFSSYLSEQGDEKIWHIAHRQLKEAFDETEKETLYPLLSRYFWGQFRISPETMRDNLLYYLYHAKEYGKAKEYFSEIVDRDTIIARITDEALVLIDAVGVEEFVSFLGDTTTSARRFRDLLLDLSEKLRYRGKFEEALAISQFHVDIILSSKMFGDLKMIHYMIAASKMSNAADALGDSEKRREIYEQIRSNLKIKGPVSLITSSLGRRFYKWELFKLNNND